MIRALALVSAIGVASTAPFQCGSHDTDPSMRTEDTAGDALWDLAQKFKAEHNDGAEKETLQMLVDQYPSSRHTLAAKDELARLGGGGSDGGT
jgi:hypothetical protein